MIEGLRALPYLQEARREGPRDPDTGKPTVLNCETCMRNAEPLQRQFMGCGYEPPLDGAQVWSPNPGDPQGSVQFDVCPGYTTQLPDVIDIADAYWWADKGAAGTLQTASVPMRVGLRVLRDAIADADALKHRNTQKGRS